MNEHDSEEAHEARNACARDIAHSYIYNVSDLAHEEALVQLLQHAWECGFDFAKKEGK